MSLILDSLFYFLRPAYSVYHVRVVDLLWEYNKLAEIHTLENVVSSQISTKLTHRSVEAIEAFGTLWRLTDDAMLPGEIFYVPICIILDYLRSQDPVVQAAAETWMRCSLLSYFRCVDPFPATAHTDTRILDPILTRLIDPASDGHVVKHTPELAMIQALIENTSTLLKFGGKGLSKACQAKDIMRCSHPTLSLRARAAAPNATTYLDLVVTILAQQLHVEPSRARPSDRPLLLRIQGSSLDVLQTIVSFGDLSASNSSLLKSSLLDKLASATLSGQCTLQAKLLRLLHSTMLAHVPGHPTHGHPGHGRSTSLSEKAPPPPESEEFDRRLVQVIIDGVSAMKNRPVLQHWVDFILMSAQYLHSRRELLQVLCDCLALQVRHTLLRLAGIYIHGSISGARGTSDVEPIMLLSALERLASLIGPSTAYARPEDTKSGHDGGSGLFGLMSGVFVADSGHEHKVSLQSRVRWNGH